MLAITCCTMLAICSDGIPCAIRVVINVTCCCIFGSMGKAGGGPLGGPTGGDGCSKGFARLMPGPGGGMLPSGAGAGGYAD